MIFLLQKKERKKKRKNWLSWLFAPGFNAVLLESLKLDLTSFTDVLFQNSRIISICSKRIFLWVLKLFLHHNFTRQVHIWLPFAVTWPDFNLKLQKKGSPTQLSLSWRIHGYLSGLWHLLHQSGHPDLSGGVHRLQWVPAHSQQTFLTFWTVKGLWMSRLHRQSSS